VDFVAVDPGAGVTVCGGVCGGVCNEVCGAVCGEVWGAVFGVAWAMTATGITSRIVVNVEQNRFI